MHHLRDSGRNNSFEFINYLAAEDESQGNDVKRRGGGMATTNGTQKREESKISHYRSVRGGFRELILRFHCEVALECFTSFSSIH